MRRTTDESHGRGRTAALAVAVLMVAALWIPSASAGSLTGLAASAGDDRTAASTTWTFSFTTESEVAANGSLRVVFPAGFGVSGDSACSVTQPEGVVVASTSVEGQAVVCDLDELLAIPAGSAVTVEVASVVNPRGAGVKDAFVVQTRHDNATVIDEASGAAPDIQARSIDSASASTEDASAGAEATWSFDLEAPVALVSGDAISIGLPVGFSASGASCDVTSPATVTAESTASAEGSEVVCALGDGDAVAEGETVSLRVDGLTNRGSSGGVGSFVVALRAADGIIASGSADGGSLGAHAFASGPTESSPDHRTGVTTGHSFAFTTFNSWAADGRFVVTFPAGYEFEGLTGFGARFASGGSGELSLAHREGSHVVFQRSGGEPIAGGTGVVIDVGPVRNPSSSGQTGPFLVSTSTGSGAVQDEGQAPGVFITGPGSTPPPSPEPSPSPSPSPSASPSPSPSVSPDPSPSPTEDGGSLLEEDNRTGSWRNVGGGGGGASAVVLPLVLVALVAGGVWAARRFGDGGKP